MTEYKETTVDPGKNLEGDILSAMAHGHPYVFIVTELNEDGSLDQYVAVGNGIGSADGLRTILEKTLAGLP